MVHVLPVASCKDECPGCGCNPRIGSPNQKPAGFGQSVPKPSENDDENRQPNPKTGRHGQTRCQKQKPCKKRNETTQRNENEITQRSPLGGGRAQGQGVQNKFKFDPSRAELKNARRGFLRRWTRNLENADPEFQKRSPRIFEAISPQTFAFFGRTRKFRNARRGFLSHPSFQIWGAPGNSMAEVPGSKVGSQSPAQSPRTWGPESQSPRPRIPESPNP